MGSDANRLNVDGHTFWRESTSGGESFELINDDRYRAGRAADPLDGFRAGRRSAEPVESGSREVMRYMRSVVKTMQRATHRAQVRPVPKPVSKRRRVPAGDFVPCPLCHGEAWHDCESARWQRRGDPAPGGRMERDRAE